MSKKRLFRVIQEVEFFMLADDEGDCEMDANSYARDAMNDGGATENVFIDEITSLDDVPDNWRSALPYGNSDTDEELTIEQILSPIR